VGEQYFQFEYTDGLMETFNEPFSFGLRFQAILFLKFAAENTDLKADD